ncbi:MAG: aminotransferase class V-fold PLP-dependent enzyme [Bryobacteraceae bacterium]
MSIYETLGVRRIINARSFSTKCGGGVLPSPVVESMRQAGEACVRISDLQEAASRVIAEATGAEAGIVTSGAAAALTLGTAACLTGLDVTRMNRLPDTEGIPNEIIVHRTHRNDYDHALRAAGARFVEVGYYYYTFEYEVESAITETTAAMFYQAGVPAGAIAFESFVRIARKHSLPVIVDAAAELPPAANLRYFSEAGADIVAYSGGKHLRGPQASGILCGRADLILSAALQHQDMDVFPESWPLRQLIAEGKVLGPPHHGIGRGFKAGKEEIIGLLTAIQLYKTRDFAAELAAWRNDMDTVAKAANGFPGVSVRVTFPQAGGKEVPNAVVSVDPSLAGKSANDVIIALEEGDPPICVSETQACDGMIVFKPEALQPGEAEIIARRLTAVLS